MTVPDFRTYWQGEDWTGFLLFIVPATRLSFHPGLFVKRVAGEVANDAALFDIVNVGYSPSPVEAVTPIEWERWFIRSLVPTALAEGHFVGPRGVIGIVVVGEHARDIKHAVRAVTALTALESVRPQVMTCEIRADREGNPRAESVRAVAAVANMLRDRLSADPGIAVTEQAFLAWVSGLLRQGTIQQEHVPLRWDETGGDPAPQAQFVPVERRSLEPPTQRMPAPQVQPDHDPAPHNHEPPGQQHPTSHGQQVTLPSLQVMSASPTIRVPPPAASQLQTSLLHQSADIVLVDTRPLTKRRGQAPTDSEAIDRLAGQGTEAVSLVYLVCVPDEESSRRKVTKGYRTTAVGLDGLFRSVVADTATMRPTQAVVTMLAATTPLQQFGPLRPAGQLPEDEVPKLPADYFDHARAVEALLAVTARTEYACSNRNIQVLSAHYVFLSSLELADAHATRGDWERLSSRGRVTWIEVDPPALSDDDWENSPLRRLDIPESTPFGFQHITDGYDIVAAVRQESSVIYRFSEESPQTDSDGEATPERPRRWGWVRKPAPKG